MKRGRTGLLACLFLALAAAAQAPAPVYKLPVWTGTIYIYPVVTGGLTVTPSSVSVAAFKPNNLWTSPQATYTLACPLADIFRNGVMQTEGGIDYNLDPTGLIVTFTAASQPQAGDIVKATYRCSQ